MGRGLSELQRTILAMARDNRVAESLGPIGYEVVFREAEGVRGNFLSDATVEWTKSMAALGLTHRSEVLELHWKDAHPGRPFHGEIIFLSRPGWCVAPLKTPDRDEAQRFADAVTAEGVEAHVWVDRDSVWYGHEDGHIGYRSDLYLWEVLDRVYGFGSHPKSHRGGTPLEKGREARHWRCEKRFDRTAIGPARYDAARVTVLKAFQRLNDRGLAVSIGWGGCLKLTLEGMRAAEMLSATVDSTVSTSSQYEAESTIEPLETVEAGSR